MPSALKSTLQPSVDQKEALNKRLWALASRTGISRLIWGIYGVCLLFIWGAIGAVTHTQLQDERAARIDRAALNAKGFAEYVGLNVFVIDRLLMDLDKTYRATGRLPAQEEVAAVLGDVGPVLQQVAIADANGNIVASTLPMKGKVSIADRPHFLAVTGNAPAQLYIGQPVIGRVSKRMSLQLVRPIRDESGAFAGAIVGSIDPTLLQTYFRNYDGLSDEGVVALEGLDGVVRLRMHGDEISWGQNVSVGAGWDALTRNDSGRYDERSQIDGLERLYAFKRVGTYPLTVVVGYGRPQVRDMLAAPLLATASFALITSLLLTGLAYIVSRLGNDQIELIGQLRASREKALEANQMKSNFLASVSHELRTPLNSILGFSELIREQTIETLTYKYADLVHRSGKHLHALVGTVLDLAKIEAGRMEVQNEPVSLREFLGTIVDVHQVSADKKGLTLSLNLAGSANRVIETDRTKLTQVLNNVLHNAIKFTTEGGIFVTGVELPDNRFMLSVIDTGCGIPAEQLAHVFERFNTLGAANEQSLDQGTGLGLALCKELVELMGGSIALASDEGFGTHVDIILKTKADHV